MASQHSFHGLEIALRKFAGARALRVVHPGGQVIAAHRHDWPLLTVPALGGYREECEDRAASFNGPAVILHPPGRCHANCIHSQGMETFSIEFDPAWLGLTRNHPLLQRSFYWVGGSVSLASRSLVRLWSDGLSCEGRLLESTANFLNLAISQPDRDEPRWLDQARRMLNREDGMTAANVAKRLNLHPRWLAHAYRQAAGEGLHDTMVRLRCERAAHLLRSTDHPIAEIAADVGFCDQSHLNRALRGLTGRTPAQIRSERTLLAGLVAAA